MVQTCCVPLCDTKVGDVDKRGAKVRFHRIPHNPDKFQLWRSHLTNSGQFQPEPELTLNSRICSKHFLREDYILDSRDKVGVGAGNHVLRKEALPSIFRWNDPPGAQLSRAVPYVRKGPPFQSKGVQCNILEKELTRKNLVIRQLLHRLAELEEDGQGQRGGEIPLQPPELEPQMPVLIRAETPPITSTITISRAEVEVGPHLVLVAHSPTSTHTAKQSPPQSDAPLFSLNNNNRASVIRNTRDYYIPLKKRKFHLI